MCSEALGDKPLQSLADRCTTDLEATSKLGLDKPGTRRQLPIDDLPAQQTIDDISAGRRLRPGDIGNGRMSCPARVLSQSRLAHRKKPRVADAADQFRHARMACSASN